MSGPGHRADPLLRRRARRARLSARDVHGPCVLAREARPGRARLPAAARTRQRRRAGLEVVREDGPHLQRRLHRRPLRDPAAPGPPVPEPGSSEGRRAAHRRQHDRELRHQHELAVLRRRVHDVVPDADGRPCRPELRLGGGGHGGADRGHSRHLRAARATSSGTSGATSTARSSTSCCRSSIVLAVAADLAGRAADVPRPCDRDDAAGRTPDDCPRPGRLADRDQAARHERRRLTTTRTRPCRSRTRTASRTSSRCSRSC